MTLPSKPAHITVTILVGWTLAACTAETDTPPPTPTASLGGGLYSCQRVMLMPQGQPPGVCVSPAQFGDFETIVDRGSLLMTSNVPHGTDLEQDIVALDIDGVDGRTINSSAVVATNYRGCYGFNGPEWLRPPGGGPVDLGILYAGNSTPGGMHDGVHAVFRQSGMNGFGVELTANGTFGPVTMTGNDPTPSKLPSSSVNAYPDGAPADGQVGYASFLSPACAGKCFGLVTSAPNGQSTMTSITDHATQNGLVEGAAIGHVLDPTGTQVLVAACDQADASSCGLYAAQIDGQGGLVQQQQVMPTELTLLGSFSGPTTASAITAGVFPDGTGQCAYIFVNEEDADGNGNDYIHVYRQQSPNLGTAEFVTTITQTLGRNGLGVVEHFRAVASNDELVLHYLDRDATDDRDSFVVRVSNSCNQSPQALFAERLSPMGNGTELEWLPDGQAPWTPAGSSGAWAAYVVRSSGLSWPDPIYEIARCWWRP